MAAARREPAKITPDVESIRSRRLANNCWALRSIWLNPVPRRRLQTPHDRQNWTRKFQILLRQKNNRPVAQEPLSSRWPQRLWQIQLHRVFTLRVWQACEANASSEAVRVDPQVARASWLSERHCPRLLSDDFGLRIWSWRLYGFVRKWVYCGKDCDSKFGVEVLHQLATSWLQRRLVVASRQRNRLGT